MNATTNGTLRIDMSASFADDPPAGMIRLHLGDVVLSHGEPHLVIMVNDCRARIEPLRPKHFESTTRFGDRFEFDAPGEPSNRSIHAEPDEVIERRGAQGVRDFLLPRAQRRQELKQQRAEKETDQMKKKAEPKDKTKMRGGLAAEKAQDEKPTAAAATKAGIRTQGKLGDVMGFAVTAVMRRLGKEGCSPLHVMAILKAQGIKPSEATVSIQTNAGKKGERGEPAPLTKEQVAELIKSAPVPAEPAKAESKKSTAKTEDKK